MRRGVYPKCTTNNWNNEEGEITSEVPDDIGVEEYDEVLEDITNPDEGQEEEDVVENEDGEEEAATTTEGAEETTTTTEE